MEAAKRKALPKSGEIDDKFIFLNRLVLNLLKNSVSLEQNCNDSENISDKL